MRFLFFVERELHVPMLISIMEYISINKLGEIGVSTFQYRESNDQTAGWGARIEMLQKWIKVPFKIINNPYSYNPDITFMADFSYQYTEGLGTIVNVGHGTISKGWFFSENTISRRENCADLICVPGTIHKEFLEKQVFQPIAVTGMPKLDSIFVKSEKDKIHLLETIHLNPFTKTVLFAPTFNPEFSLVPYVQEQIKNLIPKNFNLIIKMHGASPEDWKNLYRQMAEKENNVYYWEDMNISDALFVSDLLITDYSSVIYEFIALDKPVLLFDSPKRFSYPNYSEENIENVFRNVGSRFEDPAEIPPLIEEWINKSLTPEIREIADKFVSVRDGSSSEIVVKKALEIVSKKKIAKGTIILRSDSEDYINEFQKKHSYHYDIVGISQKFDLFKKFIHPTDLWYDDLIQASKFVETDNFLYLSDDWNLSPLFIPLAFSHLKYPENNGFIAPIYGENKISELQRFSTHYKIDSLPDEQVALQITYASSGISIPVDFIQERYIFAANKNFILNEKSYSEKEFWMKLQLESLKNNKNIATGLDLLAYRIKKKTIKKEKLIHSKTIYREINESEYELRKRIEIEAGKDDYLFDLILYYYHMKQYLDMEVYSNMMPQNDLAKLFAAIAMEKQQHLKRATEMVLKIKIINLDDIAKCELYSLLGRLSLKQNRVKEAVDYFDKALKINTSYINALLGIGSCHLMVQNTNEAKKYYETVLQLEENDLQALFGMGVIYQSGQDCITAMKYFVKVLELDEEHLNALKALLQCSYGLRDFTKIIIALENYLNCHPANIEMQYTLAGIYFEIKNYQKTNELLESILVFDPNNAEAKELLSKVMSIS